MDNSEYPLRDQSPMNPDLRVLRRLSDLQNPEEPHHKING
jgi:hypothetical protein